MKPASLFAAMILVWPLAAAAQGGGAKPDVAKGQKIAGEVCVACHGTDGNSPLAANPKVAGQFSEYLYKQMVNFKPQGAKKAERDNAVMAGMLANLADADLRNVAAFYATQKLKPDTAKDKDLAAAGQKLWRGGNLTTGLAACAGCHGPNGAGLPSMYPRIAGQFAEYIEAQLVAFKSGARANDPNGMMRGVAGKMSEKEIKAVAQYAAGLR